MDPAVFKAGFPGRLVPTTGWDLRMRAQVPERVAVRGMAFVPNPLPPEVDRDRFVGRVSDELLAAQTHLARLDGSVSELPHPDLLLRPFRLREAKMSSQIEDTFASVEEIALAAADRPAPRDEVYEVGNYLRALDYGLTSDLPLSGRLFTEMHKLLLRGVRGKDRRPGEFRSIQVMIGDGVRGFAGARFVPPPPGEVLRQCLSDFERFLNPDSDRRGTRTRYPKLIEIAMAHYQFECIHPFSDGNGRLGRLLAAISLCRDGLIRRPLVYVSAYLEQHRQRYYDLLLRVSTDGDWESWVRFFCEAIATQAADAVTRAGRLRDLRQQYIDSVTAKRASTLALRLIDLLFESPVVRATLTAERLGISVRAAQNHVDRLVDKGILEEVTGGTYGRLYVARDILRAVEDDGPGLKSSKDAKKRRSKRPSTSS